MKIGSLSISIISSKDDPNDRKWVIQNGWGDKVSVNISKHHEGEALVEAVRIWWIHVEKSADDEYSGQPINIEA